MRLSSLPLFPDYSVPLPLREHSSSVGPLQGPPPPSRPPFRTSYICGLQSLGLDRDLRRDSEHRCLEMVGALLFSRNHTRGSYGIRAHSIGIMQILWLSQETGVIFWRERAGKIDSASCWCHLQQLQELYLCGPD